MARGWHLACVLLVLGVLLVPGVRAEAPPHGDAAAAGGEHSAEVATHESEGDIFGRALDLGIWTVVVFLVLLFVLSKFAWKPILQGLEQREHSIREAAEQAEHARREAEGLRGKLQAEMDQAGEKIRAMMDDARRGAQQMKDEMIAQARAEIQADRDRVRREIETAKDQALMELYNRSIQLATAISGKVIRRQLTADDHKQLVDEALDDLAQTRARI